MRGEPMGIAPPLGWRGSGLPSDQFASQQKIVVRYKGAFDWTYLFRQVKQWFEQRRFRFYEERIKDTGKGLKADWKAERDLDDVFWKETYVIKVQAWHLTSHEVIVHGEPRKILNGMIQFTIKDTAVSDYAGLFKGKGPFIKFLGDLYMKMRWREFETTRVDVFQYRAQEIATFIQQCLNMTTKKKAPW